MKKELIKSAFKLIGHLIIVIGLLLILGLFIKELFQEVTMNIKEMTLEEKIGQMLCLSFHGTEYNDQLNLAKLHLVKNMIFL